MLRPIKNIRFQVPTLMFGPLINAKAAVNWNVNQETFRWLSSCLFHFMCHLSRELREKNNTGIRLPEALCSEGIYIYISAVKNNALTQLIQLQV